MKKLIAIILILVVAAGAFYACDIAPQSHKIIGSWRDSTESSGYEFNNDGTVIMTYMDVVVPILNIPFTGKINGTYTTRKDKENGIDYVTITYTVFSKSISKTYMYHVDKSVLTLTDPESKEQTVYSEYVAPVTTVATSVTTN